MFGSEVEGMESHEARGDGKPVHVPVLVEPIVEIFRGLPRELAQGWVVDGTLLPRRAQPTYIVVSHQDDGEVLAGRAHPTLFNDYDSGYWLDTYDLNTWRAGRWGTSTFYFLLGTDPVDETFSAQLHIVSASGGRYAQAMDCRITS